MASTRVVMKRFFSSKQTNPKTSAFSEQFLEDVVLLFHRCMSYFNKRTYGLLRKVTQAPSDVALVPPLDSTISTYHTVL
jgi:hypothetical protein